MILLEPEETLVISRYIKYLPHESQAYASKNCLLEFAMAYLRQIDDSGQLISDASPEWIGLDEDDLCALQDLIPTDASLGTKPVGLKIHRKLYEGILRCNGDHVVELHFGIKDEQSKEQIGQKLNKHGQARMEKKNGSHKDQNVDTEI